MSNQSYDWQTESSIKEQEHAEGYALEGASEAAASAEGVEHGEKMVAAETTFRADYSAERYNPNETIADGRWSTKGDKMSHLWKYQHGVDSHRAEGCTREQVGKKNGRTDDRRRFTHAAASGLNLHPDAIGEAVSLAVSIKGNRFSWHGGLSALILAVCAHCARQDVTTERQFKRLVEQWRLDDEKVELAIEKVAEITEDDQ